MKIAVIYSSKYGATEVCAKKISDNIKGESEIVNIKENNNINSIYKNSIYVFGYIVF